MSDTLLVCTKVHKELAIDNDRRIDIVIENTCFFIPIEVKIYAGEQEGQCYDYFQNAKNSQIVYLTRFGDIPSEYSRKKGAVVIFYHLIRYSVSRGRMIYAAGCQNCLHSWLNR